MVQATRRRISTLRGTVTLSNAKDVDFCVEATASFSLSHRTTSRAGEAVRAGFQKRLRKLAREYPELRGDENAPQRQTR